LAQNPYLLENEAFPRVGRCILCDYNLDGFIKNFFQALQVIIMVDYIMMVDYKITNDQIDTDNLICLPFES
jgi:hypothetical protein